MGQAKLRGTAEERAAAAVRREAENAAEDEFPPVGDGRLAVKVVQDGHMLCIGEFALDGVVSGRVVPGDKLILASMKGHGDPRSSSQAMDYLRGAALKTLAGARKNERKRFAGVTTILWCAAHTRDGDGTVLDRVRGVSAAAGRAALVVSCRGQSEVTFEVAEGFVRPAAAA